MTVCPLCGSDMSEIICDCTGVPQRINTLAGVIYQCANCQFLYKEPTQHSLDTIEEIYQYTVEETEVYNGPTLKGYDEKSPEIRLYSRVLQEVCQRADSTTREGWRLLDLGCGTGALLDRSRAFGFDPYGVELDPHFAEYARKEFGIPVVAGELRPEHFERESFDAVTMMDVIEHVTDPLELLNTAWHLMKPNGVLAIYTPNHRSLIARLALALYRVTSGCICKPAYTVFGTNHVCFFDHQTLPTALRKTRYVLDAVYRIGYDIEHQGEVKGYPILAAGVAVLETLAQAIGLPYRLLVFAHKPALS